MNYEIKYTNNKRILAQFYKMTVCKPYRMIGILILIVGIMQMCGITAGVVGIVHLDFKNSTLVILIAMGAAELAIGILLCVYHIIMGRMAMKNGMRMHNGVMPETVVKFEDSIVMTEGKTETSYNYSKISLVRESNDMFCLMLGKYAGIVLPKDGFVKGEVQEFPKWIKDKCVRL